MPSEYSIFISHRQEDRSLASIVSGALQLLSNGKLETFVCKDIPGGREWRDWIYKKIQMADIMLFLYTDVTHDWVWCFYEIGLFLDPKDTNARPIICFKDPSIEELPSPLESIQAYNGTDEGIADFLKELLYLGEFTKGKQINPNYMGNRKVYDRALQDFLNAYKSTKIRSQYFVRRAVFNIEHIDPKKGEKRFDDITIGSEDSYTMEKILLSSGKSTQWQKLYDKFKSTHQETWLDEIKETIKNIESNNALTYVMKPFWSRDNKRFLPFLTRVEKKPSEGDNFPDIIPIRIYVIFIPCSDIEKKGNLIDIAKAADPKYLFGVWQTILPTSVIRVKWKKKSDSMAYSNEDMDGEPVAYAINPTFANFYDFNYNDLPDPDGDKPATTGYLLKRVTNYVVDGKNHISKIEKDQAEVAQKIIFEGKDASAKVPFIFNENHPFFPNSSFLPCLMSKSTVGGINGPHITYLGIIYVRVESFE
jgi:hypothetical protein